MQTAQPYCTARIIRDEETLDEKRETFDDFDSVVAFLTSTYDWFANRIAEYRADNPDADQYSLGGFGVDLTNQWGSQVMVGVGRDVWAFWGQKPTRTFTDTPPGADGLVFFVDGWHYTECDRDWLVSRDQCHAWLRNWLDHNNLPEA